jgi:hypothetical protein
MRPTIGPATPSGLFVEGFVLILERRTIGRREAPGNSRGERGQVLGSRGWP